MPAGDSDGILTKEDIYYLSATGQLGTEPKRPDDPIEYQYDRPGSDYWAFKNRNKKKKKLPVSDDGNTYLQEVIVAPYTDWEKKLSIHNPGTIDPM
jgi:hypothetical protein